MCVEALRGLETKARFIDAFDGEMSRLCEGTVDSTLDEYNDYINRAFLVSSASTLPQSSARPRRPWIQQRTLLLIDETNVARRAGDHPNETQLNREITRAA